MTASAHPAASPASPPAYPSPVTLELGQPAPDFALPDQHGQPFSLAAARERGNVALVFFPFAFSGICTGELREVRDTLEDFQDDGIAVAAVSCDPMYALRALADAEGHFFPLLSDFWPHGEVSRRFGVFDEQRGCAVRGTFLVDRSGVLAHAQVDPIGTRRDFTAYRKALAALREG